MSDTQKLIYNLINDNIPELYKYYQKSNWKNDIDFKEIYNTILNNQNPSCRHILGYMYAHAQGVNQDYQKAHHLYQLAADQGLSDAQNDLGRMYYYGHGVNQDYQKARLLFQFAADQGHDNAQNNLGCMYD